MRTPFDAYFAEASRDYNVPTWLLETIAWTESTMGRLDGPGDGIGIMQVLPSTARALGFSEADLGDPRKNIRAGAAAAADIIQRQGGLYLADFYSEYNSGRRALWRTSREVSTNVRSFLHNLYQQVLGRPFSPTWTIDDAVDAFENSGAAAAAAGTGGVLALIAIAIILLKR